MFPELAGQGYFELLDQVYSTGEALITRGMELRLQGSDETQYIDFIYQPVRDESGNVTGIFIGGYEVTETHQVAAALRASEALDPVEAHFFTQGRCRIESDRAGNQ